MSATLELGAEVAQHDAEATMRLLEEIAASMKHMHVDDIDSPLRRYVGLTGISQLSQQMLALILAEVQTDDAYAFLRQDPALNEDEGPDQQHATTGLAPDLNLGTVPKLRCG